MLRPITLSCGVLLVLSTFAAAQDAVTNAGPERNRAVFPPNEDTIGQRQALLAGIKPVVDGKSRPPNIVLILSDVRFDRIRKTPEIQSVVHRTARLALVRRFPYVICYASCGCFFAAKG